MEWMTDPQAWIAFDGFGHHVPKGYIYFAMAFSLFVEMLNLRAGHRERPLHLRQPYVAEKSKAED